MSLDYLNPMANLYNEFIKILNNVVIKYTSRAIAEETEFERQDAESYIDAVEMTDNFNTYAEFTDEELLAVGIYDYNLRMKCIQDKNNIPIDTYDPTTGEGTRFRQDIVELRRKSIIDNYVEKNNYYRLLAGLPDLNTNPDFFEFVPGSIAYQCDIPIFELQKSNTTFVNFLKTFDIYSENYIKLLESDSKYSDLFRDFIKNDLLYNTTMTATGNVGWRINANSEKVFHVDFSDYLKNKYNIDCFPSDNYVIHFEKSNDNNTTTISVSNKTEIGFDVTITNSESQYTIGAWKYTVVYYNGVEIVDSIEGRVNSGTEKSYHINIPELPSNKYVIEFKNNYGNGTNISYLNKTKTGFDIIVKNNTIRDIKMSWDYNIYYCSDSMFDKFISTHKLDDLLYGYFLNETRLNDNIYTKFLEYERENEDENYANINKNILTGSETFLDYLYNNKIDDEYYIEFLSTYGNLVHDDITNFIDGSYTITPIHSIQDYYNGLDSDYPDRGDQILSKLEGIGFIDDLRSEHKLFGITISESGEVIEDPDKILIYGGAMSGPAVALTEKAINRISNNSGGKKVPSVIRLSDDMEPITGFKDNINIYYSISVATTFAGMNLVPGEYIMSTGIGWEKISIEEKREKGSNREYLNFLGSKRIPIVKARKAKNFSILQLDKNIVNTNIYETFISIYEQCRDYMAVVVYQYNFTQFIEYYDNFIAMCIMIMAELHLIVQQIPFEIRRNFFDIYAIRMLYEAYDIPYNVYTDMETQNLIAKNLNLIILHKATDKVLYDVSYLLGFKNIQIYKYYLAKQHKFDPWGYPAFDKKTEFNNDTGKLESVDNYDSMYDIYFQKEELREKDFIRTFNSSINKVSYESITSGDPYWWEDQHVIDLKNTAEYNFVESKYLGLTMSYKMSEVLFENIILLKMLLYHRNELKTISVNLTKIMAGASVSLFDAVIILLAMMCTVHKLKGELITIPSDIINVLDYLNNMNSSDRLGEYDTFAFDFDLFKKDIEGNSPADEYTDRVKLALGKRIKGYAVNIGLENKKQKVLDYYYSLGILPPKNIDDPEVINYQYNQIEHPNYYVYDNPPYYTMYSGYLKTYKRNTYGNENVKKVVPDNFKNFDEDTMVYKSIVRKDIKDIRLYEYVSETKETVLQTKVNAFDVENMFKRGELEEIEIDHHGIDVDVFEKYLSVLSFTSERTRAEKIETLNLIYKNIRNLYEFINAKMIDEDDREKYEALKAFYKAAFYSKEMRGIFEISYIDKYTHERKYRTAKNIFEYLYYTNKALYSKIYQIDMDEEYSKYFSSRTFDKTHPIYIRATTDTEKSILVVDDTDVIDNTPSCIHYSDVVSHIPSIKVGERVQKITTGVTTDEGQSYNIPANISDYELKLWFLSKVDEGFIDISYDTLRNTTDGEMKNDNYISSVLYSYINHILSQLRKIVSDVEFTHIMDNVSTLLQELLIKFIEFVKSFTVDFVGLDILFICDFKPENLIRLMDEVEYIDKTIVPKETMNFSFYDHIKTYDSLYAPDKINMHDIIAEPYFSDPDNSTVLPSNRGIVGWYDMTSSLTYSAGVYYIKTIKNNIMVESPADNLMLGARVPSLLNDDGFYNLKYKDTDYLSNGSAYGGLVPVFSADSHTIIPDSYSYTVYMVCKSADIADVIGFPVAIENVSRFHSEYGDIIGSSEYREGPSVRFLNTPLVDIYTGVGSTNMCIREYVPITNNNVKRGNDFIDIITTKDAREWHVVAVAQSNNTVKVYIDGERCLDHTFAENGDFTTGSTDAFNVVSMPNANIGQGFPDVKNRFSYYLCGMQFLMVAIANTNHNGAELKENSKWIAQKYGVNITHNIPRP